MRLLTEALASRLPKMKSTEGQENPIIQLKFFAPWSYWTWYVIEFDGKDTFYGWVYGDVPELGYFSLSELQSVRGPMGLGIERDIYFKSQPLSAVKQYHKV